MPRQVMKFLTCFSQIQKRNIQLFVGNCLPQFIVRFSTVLFFVQASREIAEQQRKARQEAENKRIEQIMSKVPCSMKILRVQND